MIDLKKKCELISILYWLQISLNYIYSFRKKWPFSLWKQSSCDTSYTIVATQFVVATLIRYLFPRTHLCSCDLYIPKKIRH